MVRTGVTESAPGHPYDHWHRPAPAIPDLRRVVHKLVESGRDKIVELQLADRPLAGQRRSDADAKDAAFRERRVDDAVTEFVEQRTQKQEGIAVGAADVLAVDEDPRIRSQSISDAERDGFETRHAVA